MKIVPFFIISSIVIFFINQAKYNFCMTSYCLSAAIPKVLMFSVVLSIIYYLVTKEKSSDKEGNNGQQSNCHKCNKKLHSEYSMVCDDCGWLKCQCKSCGCDFKNKNNNFNKKKVKYE